MYLLMNLLYSLPTEIIEYIYFINHQSYQKDINKLLNKPQLKTFIEFHDFIITDDTYPYRGDYIKHLVYHLENTFSP